MNSIMNEFVKENKGLLRFYYIAARIVGWVLICGRDRLVLTICALHPGCVGCCG